MSSQDPTHSVPDPVENDGAAQSLDPMFSPRFKTAAAMAGWDEESILFATLIVEDTPDRDLKLSKRRDPLFKAPPPSTDSTRKRRGQRRNPISVHVPIINLDDDEEEPPPIQEVNAKKKKTETEVVVKDGVNEESSCSNAAGLPCLDKLREELSCAICLEICFEPSTTSCGHSFCKKCLRSAADKCGKKCPKCRQLISNGRSCTVNTVLWNTIQLLFPKEVEARKVAESALNNNRKERVNNNKISKSSRGVNPVRPGVSTRVQNQDSSAIPHRRGILVSSNAVVDSSFARRVQRGETAAAPSGDAALALRLQRQEFGEDFRGEADEGSARRGLGMARANLRAMASRAVSIRSRGQLYL
ncbi:E3 ubiquitin-protein ligase RNF168 [Linum perenne]